MVKPNSYKGYYRKCSSVLEFAYYLKKEAINIKKFVLELMKRDITI